MQTFLPDPDFLKTAKYLDWRRLGKQRVETKQILNIVSNQTDKKGWRNHPAVLMWQGCDLALAIYGLEMCKEWKKRGYVDNMTPFFENYLIENKNRLIKYPEWIGNKEFHSCHRQTLLFKNYDWYIQFGWTEEPKYEYYWPVQKIESR
jgi:hypothetical protein